MAGSIAPTNTKIVIMVALRNLALRFPNLLFYKANTGLRQKAVCSFQRIINHYFSPNTE